MQGYVAQKGDRWYAVIYDGLDPVTGRERRSWHPAGTERADAERLAGRLAAVINGRSEECRGLSFGAYLTTRWLPAKKVAVAPSTWDGYRRKIERHVLPRLGRTALRRLRAEDLERLYNDLLHPDDAHVKPLAPKTVLEIHLVIRRAPATPSAKDYSPATLPWWPTHRTFAIPKTEMRAWNAEQLHTFLSVAAGHRLFPAFWLAASTGMRRSELLGLRWHDIDLDAARSTARSSPLPTNSMRAAARPATRDARSTSPPPPSPYSRAGVRGRKPNTARSAPPHQDSCSRKATDGRSIRTRSPKHSNGSSPEQVCPASGSTTFVTPTRPCSSKPGAGQGRQRTTRSRQAGVHDRDLPTRDARHASRRRAGLRGTRRPFYRIEPVEAPVEAGPRR